jgi:hypothetical protein
MAYGPPQIFPPLPINEPGAAGSNPGPVTTLSGTGQSFFQPAQPAPALASKVIGTFGPPSAPSPFFVPAEVFEIDPMTV